MGVCTGLRDVRPGLYCLRWCLGGGATVCCVYTFCACWAAIVSAAGPRLPARSPTSFGGVPRTSPRPSPRSFPAGSGSESPRMPERPPDPSEGRSYVVGAQPSGYQNGRRKTRLTSVRVWLCFGRPPNVCLGALFVQYTRKYARPQH
jgi:hypothetical protein